MERPILPLNVLYYGKEEPLSGQKELRAGTLSLVFEHGDLRYIRLDEHEILLRVYVAVRDRNWETVPRVISNLQIKSGSDWFEITYEAEHKQGAIDFHWKGTITGTAVSTITFAMDGEARSTFYRNRIGFCVLHPARECAGAPVRVETVDGKVVEATFPGSICADQPLPGLQDMRALSHLVLPGVWAEVRFAREAFEAEDQRNWTDASYKTFCTPLRLPYPVEVKKGTTISQSVTLSLKGSLPTVHRKAPDEALLFRIDAAHSFSVPRIGLGVASDGQPLTPTEIERLRALHLSHLRVDLRLSEPEYPSRLWQATAEANALGLKLEVALTLSQVAENELAELAGLLREITPPVCTWLIFHSDEKTTQEKWVHLARRFLREYDPAAKLGSGTNAYFFHLNRERPPLAALDLVSYSIHPQEHAFDNASLVETLEMQAATVESARRFTGNVPLAISPITLKPRFNPNATAPQTEPEADGLPSTVDPRQMSLFGACWTTGSLKHVCESGVYSVTYYETAGWRGVLERNSGSPLAGKFRSLAGGVFPLYHVFADVGELWHAKVVPTKSSNPLKVEGLAVRCGGAARFLIANFSPEEQRVRLPDLGADCRVRHLDERTVEEAMASPESFRARQPAGLKTKARTLEITLRAYGVATIDTIAAKTD